MAGQRARASAENHGCGVAGADRACHERAFGICRNETDLARQLRPAQRRGRQGTDFACVKASEREPQGCRRTARDRTHDAVQQTGRIWIEIQIQVIVVLDL